MAKYEVNFHYSSGNTGKQIIDAHSVFDARKYVEGLPGIKKVNLILPVQEEKSNYNSNKRANSSSDSSSSGGGSGSWALLFFLVLLVGIVWAAPWSTMILGGAIGTKVAEWIAGYDANDIVDPDINTGRVPGILLLIAALGLGGFGFVGGKNVKEFILEDSPVEQVQPKQKSSESESMRHERNETKLQDLQPEIGRKEKEQKEALAREARQAEMRREDERRQTALKEQEAERERKESLQGELPLGEEERDQKQVQSRDPQMKEAEGYPSTDSNPSSSINIDSGEQIR